MCEVLQSVVNKAYFSVPSVSDVDYVSVSDVELLFGVGDQRVCHDIEIIDDNICEPEPFEDFFVNLELTSGVMPILIDQARKRVVINETNATECSKLHSFNLPFFLLYIHL